MPRSCSPCDKVPTVSMNLITNGIGERDGSDGGGSCSGGGGISSSCSSDEEDGGECSRDSFPSEVHSSPAERCIVSSLSPLNGIEVKPCHVINNGTGGIRNHVPTDQDKAAGGSDGLSQDGVTPLNQDSDSGGRLRFYLDGSCVLELKHNVDDEGRPKQWVQSWGKVYNPPPPSLPSLPPAWHPQEVPSHESQDETNISPLPSTPRSSVKDEKKPQSSHYLTFFLRRRHQSSQPLRKLQFPSCCVLRRVARCPGHVAINKNISCFNGGLICTCKKRKFRSLLRSSSVEKAYNLVSIIQKLSQVVDKTNRDEGETPNRLVEMSDTVSALHQPSSSSLSSMPLPSASSSQQSRLLPESLSKNARCYSSSHADSEYELKKELGSANEITEKVDDEANRPLPEWYFDPSKASIPVTEMIGYPRPSLPVVPKLALNKKRSPEEAPGRQSLEPPSTSKRLKEDEKGVSNNDQQSSSLVCGSFCSPTVPVKCSVPPTYIQGCMDNNSVLINDGVHSESITISPKVVDPGQKKRKRGGYGRGRTIGEAVRAFVIGDILNLGGDVRTKYVPRGVFTEVASRYKIDATTTYRWWLKYCNGVRMAATGQQESSQKPFLPACIPNLSSPDGGTFGVSEPKSVVNGTYRTPDKQQRNLRAMPLGRQHCTPPSPAKSALKENGRSPFSAKQSPRSDSSVSSASMLDSSSLGLSTISLGLPNGCWNPSLALPVPSNGRLPLPSSQLPLPIGICLPYLWNYPPAAIPNGQSSASYSSYNRCNERLPPISCSEEPLDLTLPKRKEQSDEQGGIGKGSTIAKIPDHCSYSECSPDQLILKTLLSVHEQQVSTTNLQEITRQCKASKLTKGIVSQPTHAQPNLKPKHYPFVSLQIGTFEIHSSFPQSCSDRNFLKENPNKFKVIFTQRKFVYEFETDTTTLMPKDDPQQLERHSRQMACIVVPFSIVEAFWCYDTTIILQVVSKPLMFLGQRLKQVGCVPSLTVYETKKSVDLTGGQLYSSPLHQVILLKPHLVEQLKIYLILFDIRFRNLMAPAVLPVVKQSVESNDEQNS